MGWLDSLITGLFGVGQQFNQNKFNAVQAQENRDFQSDEAALNRTFQANEAALQRDWSSAEAERARDWEEEMYSKYNSLSGKIAQAEQAGVNPLFAVTGNAVSPMSATSSAPTGASAGSVGTPSGSAASAQFVDIIGSILNAKKTQAEIDLMKKQGEKTSAETGQILKNTEWMDSLNSMSLKEAEQRISESVVTIANTVADTEVKGAELGRIASAIKNTDTDTKVKEQQISVLISEVVKNTKSVDVMSAEIAKIASEVGLNRSKAKEIGQSIRNMVQEYGHNEVMNAFTEIVAFAQATDAEYKNPASYKGVNRVARQFLNEFKEIISFGFSNK